MHRWHRVGQNHRVLEGGTPAHSASTDPSSSESIHVMHDPAPCSTTVMVCGGVYLCLQIVEALESRKVSIISMDCFYKVWKSPLHTSLQGLNDSRLLSLT